MSSVCILSAVNVKHMTLVSLYTDRLRAAGIPFDLVYLDKYGIAEEFPAATTHVFRAAGPPGPLKLRRLLGWLRFRRYARGVLLAGGYDFVIVWNDVAIVLFADLLARHWPGRYCLNIRDHFFQGIGWVRRRYARAIDHAAFTTISSDGFRSFLPERPYLMVHSLNRSLVEAVPARHSFRAPGEPIRISFIGNVRFFEVNQRLLDVFAGDPRFELNFFGTNAARLERYAADRGIGNAAFHDAFPVADTPSFLARTDLINNLYGNDDVALTTALSIKLYYGVWGRLPVLGTSGTATQEVLDRYGIGFATDGVDAGLPDRLWQWYRAQDFAAFDSGCRAFLDEIEASHRAFDATLREALGASA